MRAYPPTGKVGAGLSACTPRPRYWRALWGTASIPYAADVAFCFKSHITI